MPHRTLAVVSFALLCMWPRTIQAQPVATTTEELGYWLEEGERVIVTGRVPCGDIDSRSSAHPCIDGWTQRTISGRLALAPEALVVVRGDNRYTFALDAIDRVQRPKDRIWNGAVIGYAVGFAPFALMELDCRRDPGCWEGLPTAVGLVIGGPIGFGVGALTDFLIHRPPLVFSRKAASPRAVMAPVLARDGAGIRVSLVF